jgi:hypothetical protein
LNGIPLQKPTNPVDKTLLEADAINLVDKDIVDYLQAAGSWRDPQSNDK